MAAPPLPPKGSSNSWLTDNRIDNRSHSFSGSGASAVFPNNTCFSSQYANIQVNRTISNDDSSAPPLPPRPNISVWNPRIANQLSVVPPVPGMGTYFKNGSNSFITLPNNNNGHFPITFGNTQSFNSVTTQQMAFQNNSFSTQTISGNLNVPNRMMPCNLSINSFSNNLYQSSVVHNCNRYDVQQSKSAPDLANFRTNTFHGVMNFVPSSNNNGTVSGTTNQINNRMAVTAKSTEANLESVLKFMKKKRDSNLIDLYCNENSTEDKKYVDNKRSQIDDILKLFDPLAEEDEITEPTEIENGNKNIPEHIEEPVAKQNQCASDNHFVTSDKRDVINIQKSANLDDSKATVYATIKVPENVCLKIVPCNFRSNPEIDDFCEKLKKLRSEFNFDCNATNSGVVISPTLDSYQENSLSIQLVITSNYSNKPVSFTCDVNTSIEHIISHAVCTIFDDPSSLCMDNFLLKVYGLSEYFSAHSALADYEYVHQCHKFDKVVLLTLVDVKDLRKSFTRTEMDDCSVVDVKVSDISPVQKKEAITHENINILIETLEKEIARLKACALKIGVEEALCPQRVVQAVKAICTLLSHVETMEITDAVSSLIHVSLLFGKTDEDSFDTLPELGILKQSENLSGNNGAVQHRLYQLLELSLKQIQEAIRQLLIIYMKTFNVDFEVESAKMCTSAKFVTDYLDTLLFEVCMVHGHIPSSWSQYESYYMECGLRYGETCMMSVYSKTVAVSKSFFPRIVFEDWLQFETIFMCTLPREAVLCFTIWGQNTSQVDADKKQPSDSAEPTKTILGWCGIRLFDYNRELVQGSILLGVWPNSVVKNSGPLLFNPDSSSPLLQVKLPEFESTIKFPNVLNNSFATSQRRRFEKLDSQTQATLTEIIERDVLSPLKAEEKELLWEKRNYLREFPQALPKVLLSAHGWDWACLSDIYALLKEWHVMTPVDSLSLLMTYFPDYEVRKTAIQWMKSIVSDELCDYLPQMVQVLRYEAWEDSPIAWFLLERSLTSVRVAHHLYWLLKQNVGHPTAGNRMQLMLNSLLAIIGKATKANFERQESLLSNLSYIADRIKNSKDSQRLNILLRELEITHHNLVDNPTCLPLCPSLEVFSMDVKSCSYFTSNTLPMKLAFHSPEKGAKNNEAIYKVGDDLRQDMITIQMIRIMDKLWLKEGLDLKIVTFMCVATEYRKGLVELVPESETLRKIQTEFGLTGSFKERSISEWLQKYNTSELEYQQAVENFTLSCAGYCVATYILGICDRHNDNIMLKTSGHIFHIDFGKFLGDSQMLGNIRRDRTPFVLTSDMAYVINGGDKPSKKFQYFIDLCCQAFNIVRKHSDIFFNLFLLMVSSEVPGLTVGAVDYIRRALLPELSEAEATAQFTRMIQDSLKSWFTQFNFFIHNLAQLRFTGDHNDDLLLSFIPKTFSKDTDGKIITASVIGYRKMYDPEKYYMYVVKVERQNLPVSSCIFRTYREFLEFHHKMRIKFPLGKFHPLPGNPLMGRSNRREVADRRQQQLKLFLHSLWTMAEEISHCNLVYTFFHPLLRDQEGMNEAKEAKAAFNRARRGSSVSQIHGQVKLSIVYKNNSLLIMIMHAKNLFSSKGTAPDPYVKTYLLPDPNKETKRKTKTVFKSCHPTFMEMLVYDLPLDVVSYRSLYVSIWDYDRVQENEFLGAVLIPLAAGDLKKERIQWYPLENFHH